MHDKLKFVFLILIITLARIASANASVSLGEVEVTRLLIEPTFYISEPKQSSFELSRFLFGLTWRNDNRWSAHMALGASSLLAVPKRYGQVSETFALIEGFGQWDSGLGVWRAGLIPLDFGLQGANQEELLWFPRGLLYQKGYLGLRDLGISYAINEGLYFTKLAVHNGEGGVDKDNRTWFTGKWGVNPKNLEMGVSAQVGQTSPLSTNQSGNASQDSLFSATDYHRLRLGSLFFKSNDEYFDTAAEVYLAEILTENQDTTQFAGWYVDAKYRFNSWFQAAIRCEELRYYPTTGREKLTQFMVGLIINNWNQTSNLFIYAIKNNEEPLAANNDRLQINWRWSPQPLDI